MKSILIPLSVLGALAFDAHAGLSQMNATCPGNLDVHVDKGGPVYINGKEAKLKKSNDNYFEASDAKLGVTVSISNNPDGTSEMSYTGKNRANGVCTIAAAGATPAPAAKPVAAKRETHPTAEKACIAAVAQKTNVAASKLSVTEALGAEAGIQVKVQVPGADAPWACMTDAKGKPWSVNFTGSEGAL
jgi:hypothetical protein